jgi:UDP-N-acetylglucosamine 2-epimerase (non-hydrolysing)
MRETTERPEAVDAGVARLVGTDEEVIVSAAEELLHDKNAYEAMANAISPFGDGKSAQRITDILL